MATSESTGETTDSTGAMPPTGAVDPNGCNSTPTEPALASSTQPSYGMVDSSETSGSNVG